jgi:hypothetical protein
LRKTDAPLLSVQKRKRVFFQQKAREALELGAHAGIPSIPPPATRPEFHVCLDLWEGRGGRGKSSRSFAQPHDLAQQIHQNWALSMIIEPSASFLVGSLGRTPNNRD